MKTPISRTPQRALLVMLLLFFLWGITSVSAAYGARIVLLPFQVEAAEDLQGLQRDISSIVKDSLENEGHEVLPPERVRRLLQLETAGSPDKETVNKLLRETGATHAVSGSLTTSEERISLEARVLSSRDSARDQVIASSCRGLDRVGSAAEELARQISSAVSMEQRIASIEVAGNKRVDAEAVLQRIRTSEGDKYDPEQIDRDIQKLYESGYFENITVQVQDTQKGKRLVYKVKERPVISDILIQGAKSLDQEDILEAISSESGDIINPEIIAKDLETVRELYRKEGYYNVKVGYSQESIDSGQVKLRLEIDEGKKRYIQSIRIEGAESIDPEKLKNQLALSERNFFSWFTGGGILKEKLLNRDAAALEAYYANRGFVEVKVGQPQVESVEDGLRITFRVQEGPRYKLGNISFQGDLILSGEELEQHVRIDDMAQKDAYFDRSLLRTDVRRLEELYQKHGYAFAEATPQLDKNIQAQTMDVTFALNKERKVYIHHVRITGNTKTRDNVIRRNLAISGGDLFDSEKIAHSKRNLLKLDYFKSVEIDTIPAEERGRMDLQVEVQDKATGSFSVGAGYSSIRKLFFTSEIKERNFLGRGYDLSFRGTFSDTQTQYQLGFWNPRLYDSSLGLGFDAYNSRREYDDYDLERSGGKTKFAYSIGDYTRLYWNYNLEQYTVNNIDYSTSEEIRNIGGTNWSSAVNLSAVRDTTDRRLFPTRGTKNTLSMEYSGGVMGGDDNFFKPSYDLSLYKSLPGDFVFSWHGNYAQLFENTSQKVPDFERFYLGGINTVRGYDYQDIACEDEDGFKIGGYKKFYTNTEISYPLVKDMGLHILAFFDAGEVWDKNQPLDTDLYKSWGGGIRWNSPMGPLRLEYGYPLDKVEGKRPDGRFEFSVGQPF